MRPDPLYYRSCDRRTLLHITSRTPLPTSVPRGESRFVEVRHDLWCPLLTQSKPYACEPEVRLGPSLNEAHA
jgi:hypothetical protein